MPDPRSREGEECKGNVYAAGIRKVAHEAVVVNCMHEGYRLGRGSRCLHLLHKAGAELRPGNLAAGVARCLHRTHTRLKESIGVELCSVLVLCMGSYRGCAD